MYEICFTYLKSGASFIFELWEEFDNDQKFSVGNSVDACLLSGRVTPMVSTGVQSVPPVVETAGLSKSFGPVQVLREISLEVRAGEVHAIIGENGAGKSTLMKLLAGNEKPSSGRLE